MEMRNKKTDNMPINRVILMTHGRYNPPTHMHLRMFERARDHLHTLRTHIVVGGIISPINNCSRKDLANQTSRCDMLNLALQNSDWIRLSTWELKENTLKSTRESLQHHQNILNSFISNNCDNNVNSEDIDWIPKNIKNNLDTSLIQIKLLCGVETLESISTSGLWSEEDILEIVCNYGLVVIGNEGGNPYKCIYDSDILSKYMHNIHVVTEWIPNEVNSTRIRRALRRSESVKYLLQDSVIEFIYCHGIYDAKRISVTEARTCARMEPKAAERTAGRVILMSCGSYNPPTHMHLRMFERARDHLHNLGTHVVVGGVISPVNDAYAKKELASGVHRCEMLKLALLDSDWIRLSTWEIRQQAWTRTRTSLQHHQNLLNSIVYSHNDTNRNTIDNEDLEWIPENVRNNEMADQMPIQIKLLCGGDLLESFATPGLWAEEDIAEIVGQYGLIVITREGSNPYKFIYDSDILSKHLHNIQIVTEWIPNEVSSTRIRRALKRGESVKYLLQDAVIDYVYMNGIYDANRPSIIKLELSSINSSIDYLDAVEAKYQHNAFLTPSSSDITMLETSSCNAQTTTMNDLSESVYQKNLQNNCSPTYSDDQPSPNSIVNMYNEREKLLWSMVFDSINFGGDSSSLLLQQSNRIFSHIDSPIELPSSTRARNELLAFEDTTESELATLCDNTFSEEREEDVLSITYEESSEDLNESFIRNSNDYKEINIPDTVNSENIDGIKEEIDSSDCFENDTGEESNSQMTKFETNLEIDGKYLKSLVNSKKSLKKIDDIENVKLNKEELKVSIVESKPIEPKSLEEKAENESQKEIKFFDDISYIKRLRLIINNKPSENNKNERQQLQGSLDSINLNEASVRTTIDSMTKKSKSFESIKRNTHMSYKNSEIAYCESASNIKSDGTCQLLPDPEFDHQNDEYCSACCFTTNNEQFNPSNCSSTEEDDSAECDICSSYNLHDSNEVLDCKNSASAQSDITEICEICGEPATTTDEDLIPNSKAAVIINSRPMPLSLPKAKSTIEISRGTYKMSTLDDDHFEIDNCGLQDCKLRASLDTCNKPEPLYVNVIPRHHQSISEIDKKQYSRLKSDQDLFPKSEYYNRDSQFNQEFKYSGPKDEIAMSKTLTVSGNKRLNRKGSYPKKSIIDRTQEKRRYSSVDNLQNRMFYRTSGEKFSKSRENKFMTSADSIRPSRIIRSKSLRRSTDNVGKLDSSGDNLDSLEETVDTDDNGVPTTDNSRCTKVNTRDSDTIKMILTKHGIKIISQKETVL